MLNHRQSGSVPLSDGTIIPSQHRKPGAFSRMHVEGAAMGNADDQDRGMANLISSPSDPGQGGFDFLGCRAGGHPCWRQADCQS